MKHPWFLGNYPAACWIEEKLELDNPAGDKEKVLGRNSLAIVVLNAARNPKSSNAYSL